MAEGQRVGTRSIRTVFVLAMSALIMILSLPLLLSGAALMDGIIRQLGTELLDEKLTALLTPVDRRHETLHRIGLEDSQTHQLEIRESALESFRSYAYKKTGSVFVITAEGDIILSRHFTNRAESHYQEFLANLLPATAGVLEHPCSQGDQFAVFRYYPPWKSYVGITISQEELFAPKALFLRINLAVLLLVVLTAVGFTYGLQRLIVNPIIRITRFATRIIENEPSPAAGGGFIFELAALRDHIEAMVAALRSKAAEAARQVKIIEERESELAAEKERLAVTLRSIGDGVITTDTHGRIGLLNLAAEQITGWTQEEAAGRSLAEIFRILDDRTGEPCANPVEKVLRTGSSIELENHTMLIARDGERRHIADCSSPIRDFQGRIIGVVLVFRDVTQALKTEEELFRARKLESLGVLAAGIAHDFNNILAAIMGNLDLTRRLVGPDHQARSLVEDAKKASLQARNLTLQLLTFARGGAPIRKAASISAIITDSASFVLRGSKVACTFDIPADLWLVDVDAGQISQVIHNIILNARQSMPGSGSISVVCRNVKEDAGTPREKRYVSIAIRDTGSGIPREIIGNVFDPYFSTKEKGSGLGLAVCHSIITKHEGRIQVVSTPGEGSLFTILLPVSNTCREERQPLEQVPEPAMASRILFMDDEAMIRSFAVKMLEQQGHQVQAVANGQEAIDTYRQAMSEGTPFDLVIMDLTIPGGVGGKEAVGEVLAIDPRARVIVSSGYANDPIMARFQEYGFAAVIAKPYQADDLERTIRLVLGGDPRGRKPHAAGGGNCSA